MRNLISFLILVIDIVAIIDIVKSSKDTGKKIIWILLVLILPFVGPLLYYVVGRK